MDNRRGSRCPRFEVVGRDLQADVSIVKVGLTEQTPGGREGEEGITQADNWEEPVRGKQPGGQHGWGSVVGLWPWRVIGD